MLIIVNKGVIEKNITNNDDVLIMNSENENGINESKTINNDIINYV